jgi:AMP deaminase
VFHEENDAVAHNLHIPGARVCSTTLTSNANIVTEPVINAEQAGLLKALQKCLELRDKYMFRSRQRLGDDPRDYDGHFRALGDDCADVCGVRPDFPVKNIKTQVKSQENNFGKWNIYPKPPPPHWHWKDKEAVSADGSKPAGDEDFVFENCQVPGRQTGWSYAIDAKGVYQVYKGEEGVST